MAAVAILSAALASHGDSPEEPRYWYEDYLRAIELADEDRDQDAIRLLAKVIQVNPEPNHLVRVPGNQYVRYFPYLQRARIELKLGEFAASRRSLEKSEAYGAVLKDEAGRAQLERLRREIPARDKDRDEDRAPGPPGLD